MKTITINDVSELRNVSLHPHLQDAVSAVISWASEADIDIRLSNNSIKVDLSPKVSVAENGEPILMIKYRNTDEAT